MNDLEFLKMTVGIVLLCATLGFLGGVWVEYKNCSRNRYNDWDVENVVATFCVGAFTGIIVAAYLFTVMWIFS